MTTPATTGAPPRVDAPSDDTPGDLAFERVTSASDDLDEACHSAEAVHEGLLFRGRPAGGAFSFRHASAGDSRMRLETSTFSAHLTGCIPWRLDHAVSCFEVGEVTVDHPGGSLTNAGSRPVLVPAERSVAFTATPYRRWTVRADPSFVEDIATERHDGPSRHVAFVPGAVLVDGALATWRTLMVEATPLIVGPDTPFLARHTAQVAVARLMLDLFPWRAVAVPRARGRESLDRLRRAVDYLHAHAGQAIVPADVAAAAGVHTRTLQQMMQEHLGTSPTGYLRHIRLDRARRDLLPADPSDVLVSDVARRWGFGNLGRFSGWYAERFGEYPRDTLARP